MISLIVSQSNSLAALQEWIWKGRVKMSNDSRMTDVAVSQDELERDGPGRFLAGLHIFNIILDWLADLVQLTEEEQKEAGVYLGDHRYK